MTAQDFLSRGGYSRLRYDIILIPAETPGNSARRLLFGMGELFYPFSADEDRKQLRIIRNVKEY